jgi:hypothetical protein
MPLADRTLAHRRLDLAVVAAFVLAIAAPTLDEVVRPRAERGPERELRDPSPQPGAPRTLTEYARWPAAYESWYGDGFGLRDRLLELHSVLRFFVFADAPAPMFVIGDDGWIFYRETRTVDDFRGLVRLSDAELAAYAELFEARRAFLTARGIRYLLAVAPNKETIYPEHFPARYTRVGPRVWEQLSAYLREHTAVEILDLTPPLLAAKDENHELLYSRTGTHWVGRGSLVALHALTERLARDFPATHVVTESDVSLRPSVVVDSLAGQMYLDRWIEERGTRLASDTAPPERRSDASTPPRAGRSVSYRGTRPDGPRVLAFHDSFMPFVEVPLAACVSQLALEWTHVFDVRAIGRTRPDVVIDFTVERSLLDPSIFSSFGDVSDAAWEFERSDEVLGRWSPTSATGDTWIDPELRPAGFENARSSFLRVEVGATPRTLRLPGALVGDGRDVRVRVRVETLRPGALELRYRCRGSLTYSASNGGPRELFAGENVVYFDLDRSDAEGPLELSLFGSGWMSLHSIETRRAFAQGTFK